MYQSVCLPAIVLYMLICLLSLFSVCSHQELFAGNSSSLLDISADGKLLAVTNRDSGTVTIVDLPRNAVKHEVSVGKFPEGVSFIGATHRLAVAVYAEDRLVMIDADSGERLKAVDVFDEPYGVVSNRSGSRLFVTLDYPGEVLEIETETFSIVRQTGVESFSRGLAIDAADQFLYVTGYYTGNLHQLELSTGHVVQTWQGNSVDNLSRQVVLHPFRPKAYLPHIRSRITVAHGAGSIFPLLSVVSTDEVASARRTRIPLDSFIGNRVTCNPWEADITADGKTLAVVFAGTNDLFLCHVLDDNYREVTFRNSVQLGNNPRAVKFSNDGQRFYVYNALDFEVVCYETDSLRPLATIPVTESPLSAEVLLGKKLFYTALPPMTSRLWISCASCHPDGQPDGRTWQNPEGLRNTQSLAGMAWTHPIHWSADRDEVQDFEHTIRGPLMQGRGLMKGPAADALGDPYRGRSSALDALSAYSNTHQVSISPYAKLGLSAAAVRGKKLFHSSTVGCAQCHSGPFYTDSRPDQSPFLMHDVGTGKEDETELMGTAYDTPTLLGVYRTAPYFHDGSAATLTDLLTTSNPNDQHGKTSQLSETEIADLVEFLKALPFEDPQPAAQAAGLISIQN